jgi:hypothetical protein
MKHLLLFVFFLIAVTAYAQRVKMVMNPYENVDWKNTNRYKANFHMHTTNSDGSLTADYVVDTYAQNDYKIIMITDHDILTWPWTQFSKIKADWKDRNPDSMKVLTFPAIELDDPHHRGLFFARVPGKVYDMDSALHIARDSSALMIMNHPGRYWKLKKKYSSGDKFSPEWYVDYLNKYPEIVGLEVYNRPNDVNPFDRILWDEVLTRTMPGRPVWAFASDDMHGKNQMMGNYEFMLMSELTIPALKTAMKKGSFYASNEPGHSGQALAPRIDSIKVNQKKREIKVYAHDFKTIRWFSEVAGADSTRKSNMVGEGDIFNFRKFERPYVRFELKNDKGTTISQPFGFAK